MHAPTYARPSDRPSTHASHAHKGHADSAQFEAEQPRTMRLLPACRLAHPASTGVVNSNDTVSLVQPSPGSPNTTFHGFWAAVDCATGDIVWQTVSPLDGDMAVCAVSVSSGASAGANAYCTVRCNGVCCARSIRQSGCDRIAEADSNCGKYCDGHSWW